MKLHHGQRAVQASTISIARANCRSAIGSLTLVTSPTKMDPSPPADVISSAAECSCSSPLAMRTTYPGAASDRVLGTLNQRRTITEETRCVLLTAVADREFVAPRSASNAQRTRHATLTRMQCSIRFAAKGRRLAFVLLLRRPRMHAAGDRLVYTTYSSCIPLRLPWQTASL